MFVIRKHPHNNPALESLTVSHETENLLIRIYPNLGASLQELVKNNVHIIDGISNDEAGLETYKNKFNSSWLFPFPNRIENGVYTFEGKEYSFETNETALNNALHGFVFNKHFNLIKEELTNDASHLTFEYSYDGSIEAYPFPFDLQIVYKIKTTGIEMEVIASNTGNTNLPFGLGWHPYFRSDNLSESILNMDGFSQYEVNDKMIPVKEVQLENDFPLILNEVALDDCFMSKTASTSFKTDNYNLKIDFEPESERNFIQCYTPPTRDCIAIEPMTCAPNVFNNEDGLLVLKPHEKYKWYIKMSI